MENRQISHTKEFQLLYVATSSRMEHKPPPIPTPQSLKCRLCIVTFFQRIQYRKG